jgi:hypothetical protein
MNQNWITDVSFTVQPVHGISSFLIQFIIKEYDSHLERSERLQLRVCMLKQTSLPLKSDVGVQRVELYWVVYRRHFHIKSYAGFEG